jgi:tetratricopeptide (TPR) repeat protein
MPLMPEVYLRVGDLYLRKGDRPKASDAFAAARRLKPDYWPAYTRWADELVSLRLFDAAEALIDEGLLHEPNEPQLLERQRKLAVSRGAPPRGRTLERKAASAAESGRPSSAPASRSAP